MHICIPWSKIVRAFRHRGPQACRGLTVGILVGALIHLPAAPVLAGAGVKQLYYGVNPAALGNTSWLKARADSRDALAKAAQAVFGKNYASEAAFVAAYDKVVKQAEKAIAALGTREYRGTETYQAADGVQEDIDAGTGFRKTRPLKRMETVDIYWAPGWCVDVEARGDYKVYVLPTDEELQNRVEAMYDLTKFELASFKFVPNFNKYKVTATFTTRDLTRAGAKAASGKKVLDFDLEPATAAFTYPVPEPGVTVTKVTETPYPLYTEKVTVSQGSRGQQTYSTQKTLNPLGQWTVHYEVPPPAPFEEVKSGVQSLSEQFGTESSTSRQVFSVPYAESGATIVVNTLTPSAPVAPTGGASAPGTIVEYVRVDYVPGPSGKKSGTVDRHEIKAVSSVAYAAEEGEWTTVGVAPGGKAAPAAPARMTNLSGPKYRLRDNEPVSVVSKVRDIQGADLPSISAPSKNPKGSGNGAGGNFDGGQGQKVGHEKHGQPSNADPKEKVTGAVDGKGNPHPGDAAHENK
ncbi:MAG: hypothetical protein VKP72_09395 [bacterium]|nr:hypothetical protein [bacterium]